MCNLVLVYSIIFLLAAQGAKSIINVDPNTCFGPNGEGINVAINEMTDMADWAFDRTYRGSTNQLPSKDDQRVVYNTFASYFKMATAQNNAAITKNLLSMTFSSK